MIKQKKKLYFVISVFLMITIWVCAVQVGQEDMPFSILIFSDGEMEEIKIWEKEEGEYFVFLPSHADLSQTQIRLNTGTSLQINDCNLTEGMYCDRYQLDVPYELSYTAWGKEYQHSVTFVQSGNVATMYIDTESGSMDYIHEKKGNEESGTLRLYTAEGDLNYSGDLESINGRGNHSWDFFEKKPYSLKFAAEPNLLGMGQAQKWILLANAEDPSNIRNKIVYDFAGTIGMAYSPDSQWVDLYLNGEYVGLYLLCERNEVHSQRVDIAATGSFLVSMEPEDRMTAQNYTYVSTQSGQALRIHYPQNISGDTLLELAGIWQSVENAIIAENGIDPITDKSWIEQINLDSWVKKYLMEEIFGSGDACYSSQFFYFDNNDSTGKIYAGPVWDFDRSMGNEIAWQLVNPNVLYANRPQIRDGVNTPWFSSLYQKEEFYKRMVELYQSEFLPELEKLLNGGIRDYAVQILRASAIDQIRWDVAADEQLLYSENIVEYMTNRIAFLSSIWVEDNLYYLVRADQGFGANYANFAVLEGECLEELPTFEDTDTSTFLGWYYENTNELFDITQPITEDTQIYAKWRDSSSKKIDQMIKLMPLGIIAVMGVVLLLIDIKRMKTNR